MKTFFRILFFFLLVTQICFAQWYQQTSGTTANLNAVQFIDANNGCAVGDSGIILKTASGGLSWLMQETNLVYQLRSVCFVDINNGWAVGENGTILNTSDGGLNWIMQTSGVTDNLNDIAFAELNNGLAVGENGRILKTTNGGSNWSSQTIGATISLYGVCLVDISNGWIVGDNSTTGHPKEVIRRTTNGGNTWIVQSSPNNYEEELLYDVYFTNLNTGWVVGRNHDGTNPWGEILKTTNGGSTWIAQSCPTQSELSSVYFIDSNNGWATTSERWYGGIKGHVLKTTNGGATWLVQYLGVSKPTNGIYFTNSNCGIAVGEGGTIQLSTDAGNNWNSPPCGSTNDWTDVCFTDLNNGLVIGDGGTIIKTTNGGTSWSSIYTGTTNDFTSICFVDANEGWAVTGIVYGYHTELGDSSFIFHTTDGGVTWIKQLTMPLTLFDDISFVDANNGWAVGTNTDSIWWMSTNTIILRTTNGGTIWNQVIYDTIPQITNICFVNPNTGWIITWTAGMGGSESRIYKTTDGGESWFMQFGTSGSYPYSHLSKIYFTNQQIGIAVGFKHDGWYENYYGLIVRTTDGGENWITNSSDSVFSGLRFYDLNFISNEKVVVLGEDSNGDILYWSSDVGENWIPRYSGVNHGLHHLSFVDSLTGWIAGDNGTILHTTNGGVTFIEEEKFIGEIPSTYFLSNNFPNPFNPSTKIKYSIPKSSQVTLKIFNTLGEELETLVNEEKPVGTYEVNWNAANLPSGVYFYQLKAGEFMSVKKMILIK